MAVLVDLLAPARDRILQDPLDLNLPLRAQNLPPSVDLRDGGKKIPLGGPTDLEIRSEAIEAKEAIAEKEMTEVPEDRTDLNAPKGPVDSIDRRDREDLKKDLATIREEVVLKTVHDDRSLILVLGPLPVDLVVILAGAFVPAAAQPVDRTLMPREKPIQRQQPTRNLNGLFVPIFPTMKCAILAKIPA